MRNKIFTFITVAMATVSVFFASCEDATSNIGGSISSSEVTISVDSLTYDLFASTVEAPYFESRSAYTLLGSIRVPEYGELDCSYVTQFLPAESLNIPDSIGAADIDSVKVFLNIPKTYVTGDTLAPQQMKVFSLTKQLPSDIASNFNPDGYFDPSSPLAVKSYTLSGYNFNDSTYTSSSLIELKAKLPVELGRDLVGAYKTNPDIFIWPEEFAKRWPGVYVAPSFGKGCIAAVYSTNVFAYFPQTVATTETGEDGKVTTSYKQVADSVCMLTTAPEVLSSVNISYQPSDHLKDMISDGKSIITTPGGYVVSFRFPAEEILEEYWSQDYDLGVINNMIFKIKASQVKNSYGLGMAPALLMVKTSELDTFFSEGRLPDNKNSFTSIFSSEDYSFTFNQMREYIVNLREKGKGGITDEDVEFTLIPVSVSTEEYTDPSTYTPVTAVTAISPYIIMPTMMELDTANATVVFTFSNQILN